METSNVLVFDESYTVDDMLAEVKDGAVDNKAGTETYGALTSTFTGDFNIAEAFGAAAVKDTFERAFGEWRSDIGYLANLTIVVNHRSWQADERGDKELTELYISFYETCMDEVWGEDSPFDDEEKSRFFSLTD